MNNKSAAMQPGVALFIPVSCNSLESWDCCPHPGEGETEAGVKIFPKSPNKQGGELRLGPTSWEEFLSPTHGDTV